jgi:predicted ABC-type transport system involved in lysophospholipase L1 biosynthesis ATPase subunit
VTSGRDPVIELAGVSKDYRSLRPLRIDALTLNAGEHIALLGLDQPMAETLINLITGAALPDRGDVRMFGRTSASIDDSADWLAVVDRFGIVSERAVLLDHMSVVQNLSLPLTLEIEPPAPDTVERAIGLGREAGLGDADWPRAVSELDAEGRLRVRIARALAFDPDVLLLEHASAPLPVEAVGRLGADIRRLAAERGCALLAATVDPRFAAAVAARVLTLEPATGRLTERRGLRQRLFGS